MLIIYGVGNGRNNTAFMTHGYQILSSCSKAVRRIRHTHTRAHALTHTRI